MSNLDSKARDGVWERRRNDIVLIIKQAWKRRNVMNTAIVAAAKRRLISMEGVA
jgi:hypothetical protein